MKRRSTVGLSASTWPSVLGSVGQEYHAVTDRRPGLLIWIRQSADEDKLARLSVQYTRLRNQLETSTVKSLKPVFANLSNKILKRFDEAATTGVQAIELFHQAELHLPFVAAMRPCWIRLVENGMHFEAQWAGTGKPQFYRPKFVQHELPSIDVEMSPQLQAAVKDWLKQRTEGVWSEVAKTVHKRLEKTLSDSLRDGLDLNQQRQAIQATLKGIQGWQAQRIARTETTGGMNFGQHAERVELSIGHKEWVATFDARTRGLKRSDKFDHITAHGQTVDNDKMFMVSGQQLMYPADSSGGASAGNIVNCRCAGVGAWPKSPLKPRSPSPIPTEQPKRPPGWIQPSYEKAVTPTTPPPSRPVPALTAPREIGAQYLNLVSMDMEARSTLTTDRINMVRDALTAKNDILEAIRQKVINYDQSESDECKKRLESIVNEFNAFKLGKTEVYPPKLIDLLVDGKKVGDQLDKLIHSTQLRLIADVGTPDKADLSATSGNKISPRLQQEIQSGSQFVSKLLSRKVVRNLTVQFNQLPNGERAYYDPATGKIWLESADRKSVVAHELSHRIEDLSAKTAALAKGFLYHRIGTEPPKWVGCGGQNEIGAKDDFAKLFGNVGAAYTGRFYHDGTEIISMGVQRLNEDPVQFAKVDPEYFKFIVGILRGDLL